MDSLSELPCKRIKQECDVEIDLSEISPAAVRMAGGMFEIPKLPFEKILGYLSLEDLIRSRRVSKGWYLMIGNFRVSSLCYSERPSGFIVGKSRLVSGAFAQNFVSSPRFETLFNASNKSILSDLKRLRLCDILHLSAEDRTALALTLNSFDQLEELDLIRLKFSCAGYDPEIDLELSLPMLNSIHLERVDGIERTTLDAPRLKQVKVWNFYPLKLRIVHAESVERFTWYRGTIEVQNLKNLRYLHIGNARADDPRIDPTLLSSLERLKEIHLISPVNLSELFEQKQRYGRTNLKIFLCGIRLNGRDDPVIENSFSLDFSYDIISCLADNNWRLADEIPLCDSLIYAGIERVRPEEATFVLSRFTDLHRIIVDRPVNDIERFLGFLKSFDNIVVLRFSSGEEPAQDLLDRLPDYCAIQSLYLKWLDSDEFLLELENLTYLSVPWLGDVEFIRKLFESLKFLSSLHFCYNQKFCAIEIDHLKRFDVRVFNVRTNVQDLNAAIQFITENAPDEEEDLD